MTSTTALPVAVTNAHVTIHPNTAFGTDANGSNGVRSAALPTVYNPNTGGTMASLGKPDLALAHANIEAAVAVDPNVLVVAVDYGSTSVAYLFKGINWSLA